jgi:hypothetical protein
MTSPRGSLRKSIGNIITKIANRPSIDGSDEIKQAKVGSLPCYVCSEKNKKNIQCRTCSKVACILHSSVTSVGSTERFCDECVSETLVKDMSYSDQVKEKLSNDIQDLVSKRDANTKLLNKESGRIRGLQTEMKEAKEKGEAERIALIKRIQMLQNENKRMQEEVQGCVVENSKNKAIVEYNEKRNAELEREREHVKINVDQMTKERTELLAHLNELTDFIRLQVPVRIVKKIVCANCYVIVQNAFAGMFKHVVPIKNEQIANVQRKKQGACASCNVF